MRRREWSRNRGQSKPRAKSYQIRMGQLLGPYSVGAIFPCDANNVVMIAGLDPYESHKDKMEQVFDSRLCRHIGVSALYEPPKYVKGSQGNAFIPAVRFPGWMYCPKCKRMEYRDPTDTSPSPFCSRCYNETNRKIKLVPERFIVVCPEGHVDDFPVMKWVHDGQDINPKDPHHIVTRNTQGGSATMGDIVYKCSCGAGPKTLRGATNPQKLEDIAYHCQGRKPWLDIASSPCSTPNENLRVVIMGATNVCYSDTVSSVLIPDPWEKSVRGAAASHLRELLDAEEHGDFERMLGIVAREECVRPEELRLAFKKEKSDVSDVPASEDAYRYDEYMTLKAPEISRRGEFVGESVPIMEYDSEVIQDYFSGITLVDTLTVTRALVGLSRLNPEANAEKSMWERRASLSKERLDWTVAVQTIGEGIFIELDGERLEEWENRPVVQGRIRLMQENLSSSRAAMNLSPKELNPRFVTIHTLAHLLMLGISEVCGYAAASLRERIYCERYIEDGEPTFPSMHGLLIYTSSGSGDGSLGGLVRSGEPGRFEEILQRTLEKALWCSSDPVCIESPGQGLDSCNLAACYNCTLVPETSCEAGNRLLDRGLLVGTIDDPRTGLLGTELHQ